MARLLPDFWPNSTSWKKIARNRLTHFGKNRLIRPVLSQALRDAQIAQSVEQGIENPRVGGSIPPLGTIFGDTTIQFVCRLSSVGRATDL